MLTRASTTDRRALLLPFTRLRVRTRITARVCNKDVQLSVSAKLSSCLPTSDECLNMRDPACERGFENAWRVVRQGQFSPRENSGSFSGSSALKLAGGGDPFLILLAAAASNLTGCPEHAIIDFKRWRLRNRSSADFILVMGH